MTPSTLSTVHPVDFIDAFHPVHIVHLIGDESLLGEEPGDGEGRVIGDQGSAKGRSSMQNV